jgi:hypothetical protein
LDASRDGDKYAETDKNTDSATGSAMNDYCE